MYVVYGYAGAPPDQAAQCAGYVAAAEKWLDTFTGGQTFVGGDTPSIADYKAAPFFFSAVQPAMKKKIGMEMPPKVGAALTLTLTLTLTLGRAMAPKRRRHVSASCARRWSAPGLRLALTHTQVVAYVDAFCKAVASSAFMKSAGGYSLGEIAASKC